MVRVLVLGPPNLLGAWYVVPAGYSVRVTGRMAVK